jgi:ribosomal protein S12 methylthiotransferase
MNRPSKDVNTHKLVERIRERVPNVALRTTMIVGFPGETRLAHLNMLQSMRELRFNWLGAFQYSTEEGTPAAAMTAQLSRATKQRRWQATMELQSDITAEWNRQRVGTHTRVLVESFDADRNQYVGRSPHEAPDIDGNIYFTSPTPVQLGAFYNVEITSADVYDVEGRIVSASRVQ